VGLVEAGKVLKHSLVIITDLHLAQHLALLIDGGDEAEPFVQIDSSVKHSGTSWVWG